MAGTRTGSDCRRHEVCEAETVRRSDIEAKLAAPETYSDPGINVADLQREKVRLEREIAHAEHEWLVAQEAYEAA